MNDKEDGWDIESLKQEAESMESAQTKIMRNGAFTSNPVFAVAMHLFKDTQNNSHKDGLPGLALDSINRAKVFVEVFKNNV